MGVTFALHKRYLGECSAVNLHALDLGASRKQAGGIWWSIKKSAAQVAVTLDVDIFLLLLGAHLGKILQ